MAIRSMRVTLTIVTLVSLGATARAIETTYGEDPVPTTHRLWKPFKAYGMDPVPQKSLAERWTQWRARRPRLTIGWDRGQEDASDQALQSTESSQPTRATRVPRAMEVPRVPPDESWDEARDTPPQSGPLPILFTDSQGDERPLSSRRGW